MLRGIYTHSNQIPYIYISLNIYLNKSLLEKKQKGL